MKISSLLIVMMLGLGLFVSLDTKKSPETNSMSDNTVAPLFLAKENIALAGDCGSCQYSSNSICSINDRTWFRHAFVCDKPDDNHQ